MPSSWCLFLIWGLISFVEAQKNLTLGIPTGLKAGRWYTKTICYNTTDNETVDCHVADFCYLPSGPIQPLAGPKTCSTPNSLLGSLAIYDCFAAAFIIVMGHKDVRSMMPYIFSNDTWTPTAGGISIVLQVVAMAVSTALARMGPFKPAFHDLFGMWTMRPRIGWTTFFWNLGEGQKILLDLVGYNFGGVRAQHSGPSLRCPPFG